MGKTEIAVACAAMLVLSVVGVAHSAAPRLSVEGKVYCDTCHTQFITRVSSYVKDAKVRLECRETEGGSVTYGQEAITDASGAYKIAVEGDHEDEICEVNLVKSSLPECSEITKEPFSKLSARVSLTFNNGMATPVRQANPLGFLASKPLPECPQVLRELGIAADGHPAFESLFPLISMGLLLAISLIINVSIHMVGA